MCGGWAEDALVYGFSGSAKVRGSLFPTPVSCLLEWFRVLGLGFRV